MMHLIPTDLHEFLKSGRQLEHDVAMSDVGEVRMVNLNQVQLALFSMNCDDTEHCAEDPHREDSGSYLVEGIDLIHESTGGYESAGLLMWLPLDKRYAAWDSSHNKIFVFEESTQWADIARDPNRYLNAQWDTENSAPTSALRPWMHHVYNSQQVFRKFPIPAQWFVAEQTLRGNYVNGKQMRIPRRNHVHLEATELGFNLHATVSQMNEKSDWVVDQTLNRLLSDTEVSDLQALLREKFWSGEKCETDFGESRIIWSLEGFQHKRYASITQFYSDHPIPDRVSDVGESILILAGIPRLESFLP